MSTDARFKNKLAAATAARQINKRKGSTLGIKKVWIDGKSRWVLSSDLDSEKVNA